MDLSYVFWMDLIHVILSCELEWIQVTQWWTNFVRTYSADRIIIVRQNSSEQNIFFQLHSGEQIVLGYIQNFDSHLDDDSDGDSDDDSIFPHFANGYANPVEIGVSSIDLNDDEDTKSNEENDDERMREVTDSAIRRAFREDESRQNAPLMAETTTRVMEGWGPIILYWTKAPNSEDWVCQGRRGMKN